MPQSKYEKRNIYNEVMNKNLNDTKAKKSNINIMLIVMIIVITGLIIAWLLFGGYFSKTETEKVIEKYLDIDTGAEVNITNINAGLFEELKDLD